MNIKNFIVDEKTNILKAMEKIDDNQKGIVYVCQKNIVTGTITDGDIRRYILKGKSTFDCVLKIANMNPKTLSKAKANTAISFMNEMKISSVPIVDDKKKLLYIVFSNGEKLYDTSNLNVPVVIMAGGKGTRLYPYTKILPKPLIPIGDITITEHIFNHFKQFGCDEFTMIVNYKKEFIKAYFKDNKIDNINFVDELEFMGTGGGLKLLENIITETFFLSNCDILVEENYVDIYNKHKKEKNILTIICAKKNIEIPYGVIHLTNHNQVNELVEKPSFNYLTNTGFYVIEPEFLNEIPANTFVHVTDVIKKCIEKKLKVGVYIVEDNSWLDMGQLDELEIMKKRLE
ncbi:MAG: sugar phosphate nucleotidyltransferase [Erysipelotrichaceae bacterium]